MVKPVEQAVKTQSIFLLYTVKVLVNKAKALTKHITNTPHPHPSVGECLSPLVGGDTDMQPKVDEH